MLFHAETEYAALTTMAIKFYGVKDSAGQCTSKDIYATLSRSSDIALQGQFRHIEDCKTERM